MAIPYWQQRQRMKNGLKPTAADEKKEKNEIGIFFKKCVKGAPSNCQNCKKYLAHTMKINPAAVVCHILPKRKTGGVPSMATNVLNIVYLCGDCHTNMDNKGSDFVRQMKIYTLMCKRVALMWPHIPEDERKNVPAHFLPSNFLRAE